MVIFQMLAKCRKVLNLFCLYYMYSIHYYGLRNNSDKSLVLKKLTIEIAEIVKAYENFKSHGLNVIIIRKGLYLHCKKNEDLS